VWQYPSEPLFYSINDAELNIDGIYIRIFNEIANSEGYHYFKGRLADPTHFLSQLVIRCIQVNTHRFDERDNHLFMILVAIYHLVHMLRIQKQEVEILTQLVTTMLDIMSHTSYLDNVHLVLHILYRLSQVEVNYLFMERFIQGKYVDQLFQHMTELESFSEIFLSIILVCVRRSPIVIKQILSSGHDSTLFSILKNNGKSQSVKIKSALILKCISMDQRFGAGFMNSQAWKSYEEQWNLLYNHLEIPPINAPLSADPPNVTMKASDSTNKIMNRTRNNSLTSQNNSNAGNRIRIKAQITPNTVLNDIASAKPQPTTIQPKVEPTANQSDGLLSNQRQSISQISEAPQRRNNYSDLTNSTTNSTATTLPSDSNVQQQHPLASNQQQRASRTLPSLPSIQQQQQQIESRSKALGFTSTPPPPAPPLPSTQLVSSTPSTSVATSTSARASSQTPSVRFSSSITSPLLEPEILIDNESSTVVTSTSDPIHNERSSEIDLGTNLLSSAPLGPSSNPPGPLATPPPPPGPLVTPPPPPGPLVTPFLNQNRSSYGVSTSRTAKEATEPSTNTPKDSGGDLLAQIRDRNSIRLKKVNPEEKNYSEEGNRREGLGVSNNPLFAAINSKRKSMRLDEETEDDWSD